MYNQFLDRDDANGRDESTSRIKMRWLPNNRWVVDVSLSNTEVDNGYDAFSLDNNRITLSDEPGFDRQNSNYASVKSKWSGQNYEITAILGAANSDIDYGYDEDWSFTGIHPIGYTSTDHYLRERKTPKHKLFSPLGGPRERNDLRRSGQRAVCERPRGGRRERKYT